MDRDVVVENLETILKHEIDLYVAYSFTSKLYLLVNESNKVYAVASVPQDRHKFAVGVVVMAQVVDDCIVILEDRTDKPLVVMRDLSPAG